MNPHDHRIRIAVLGSGAGSNAAALIDYTAKNNASYRVDLVLSSRADAGIVDVARERSVPVFVLPSRDWERVVAEVLKAHHIDLLALAGFMRKLPQDIIDQLHGNVLNIHPSLLPRHGGQGMYGIHVHRAVLVSNEVLTGATVHRVTSEYDEGAIVAQRSIEVLPGDDPFTLQERVKTLEHALFPSAIDEFCRHVQDAQPRS